MSNERYNILCKGRRIYTSLTEEEYFNTMEDLSIEYYQTGSPNPEDFETEILLRLGWWLIRLFLLVILSITFGTS